jgi:hypothetical protein
MVQFPQAYQMFEPPTLPVDSELDAIAKVLALFNSDERPRHYVTSVSVPEVSEPIFLERGVIDCFQMLCLLNGHSAKAKYRYTFRRIIVWPKYRTMVSPSRSLLTH